jgi:hypothetical protein
VGQCNDVFDGQIIRHRNLLNGCLPAILNMALMARALACDLPPEGGATYSGQACLVSY